MPVEIGTVQTFPSPKADKAQVLKIAEEEHEVFSAWELYDGTLKTEGESSVMVRVMRKRIIDECADLITATCNLLAALGVDDMKTAMAACGMSGWTHEVTHVRWVKAIESEK